MKRTLAVLDRILDLLVVVALLGMIFVLGLQVFYRYVLNDPLVWPMPVSLFLFIWAVWLGGATAIRDRTQIRVELAERYLPRPVKRFLLPGISLVCTAFLAVVVYKSLAVVKIQSTAIYDTLPISRSCLFIVAPIVGSLMFLQYLRVFLRQIREYSIGRKNG